jgi:hypothetical protein
MAALQNGNFYVNFNMDDHTRNFADITVSTVPLPYCALGDERVKSFKQSSLPF